MQVSQFCETWVITRSNNRQGIEQFLARHPRPTLNFVYYDLPAWARFWKRGRRGIHVYYYLWQLGSARVARTLHRENAFDLAHHLTLSAYWMPSGLAFVGARMIVGPLGGAESLPRDLATSLPLAGRLYESFKSMTHIIAKTDPLVRYTLRRSAIVLLQTPGTLSRMSKLLTGRHQVVSAVGIDSESVKAIARTHTPPVNRFRVVSVGRLLGFKAYHLALKAFAAFLKEVPDAEYVIVGGGPEDDRLRRLVGELGITDAVIFTGALPRPEVLKQMASSHVFLHTSLRDPPASVIAEAMAAGLPVVCLANGGPAAQVTKESGITVAVAPADVVVAQLGRELIKLATDIDLRRQLSEGALRRATDEFDWPQKRRVIEQIYRAVLAAQ
jgi:glycosyltransferase involved in cell wall biosynthesis